MNSPTKTTPLNEADYKQIVQDLSLVFWTALALQRGNALIHSDAAGLLAAAIRLQALPAALIPVVFGNGL